MWPSPLGMCTKAGCLASMLVAASGQAQLQLGGGADGWEEGQWYVQVDGVMGGKSSGNVEYSNGTMVFSGSINLDGGGFSSVRKRKGESMDFSSYAGLVVELESEILGSSERGAPLGLHVELGDSSWFGFSAAVAVPFSQGPEREPSRIFIPMDGFDRADVRGFACSLCKLNTKKVDEVSVYVLFQSGPFDVRVRGITAVPVKPVEPLPSTPSVNLTSAAVSSLISETIVSGGALYDKDYKELCAAIYATTARQILAATGPSLSLRSLACVGLRQAAAAPTSKAVQAWSLRKTFDAIRADLDGTGRIPDSRYPASVRGPWLPEPGVGADSCDDLEASNEPATPVLATAPASNAQPASSVEGILGPFVGMGISGYNDFGRASASSAAACTAKCLQEPKCRSVDYGARGNVAGECWLSTADRASVGAAYRAWDLYDYYERDSSMSGLTASGGDQVSGASSEDTSDDKNFLMGSAAPNRSRKDDPKRSQNDDLNTMFWVVMAVVLVLGAASGAGAFLVCKRRNSPKHFTGNKMDSFDNASITAMGSTLSDPTVVVVGQPVHQDENNFNCKV